MYQDHANADLVQDADLFDKCIGLDRVNEDLAACLDDKYLALEQAYLGCRVLECGYNNRAVSFLGHEEPPSI